MITFEDGTQMTFARGRFDGYLCVCLDENGKRADMEDAGLHALPLDVDYLGGLKALFDVHGEQVFTDWHDIYTFVTSEFDQRIVDCIMKKSEYYGEDKIKFQKIQSILYLTEIAECARVYYGRPSKLQKRIKALAIHQLIRLDMPLAEVTEFSKGKPWRQLDEIMKGYGV